MRRLATLSLLCFLSSHANGQAAGEYEIRLNHAVTLQDPAAKVTFVFAQDDRCPEDVTCISAGSAYALLWLEYGAKKTLLGVAWPSKMAGLEVPATFMGYDFCFQSLLPKVSTRDKIDQSKLVLRFKVVQRPPSGFACGA